ncbi:MAG: hypothetical protein M1819_000774 [Sarea resinae]|nr:MAG: hypothetical protein M1819_000774 [Sarea resinae]
MLSHHPEWDLLFLKHLSPAPAGIEIPHIVGARWLLDSHLPRPVQPRPDLGPVGDTSKLIPPTYTDYIQISQTDLFKPSLVASFLKGSPPAHGSAKPITRSITESKTPSPSAGTPAPSPSTPAFTPIQHSDAVFLDQVLDEDSTGSVYHLPTHWADDEPYGDVEPAISYHLDHPDDDNHSCTSETPSIQASTIQHPVLTDVALAQQRREERLMAEKMSQQNVPCLQHQHQHQHPPPVPCPVPISATQQSYMPPVAASLQRAIMPSSLRPDVPAFTPGSMCVATRPPPGLPAPAPAPAPILYPAHQPRRSGLVGLAQTQNELEARIHAAKEQAAEGAGHANGRGISHGQYRGRGQSQGQGWGWSRGSGRGRGFP